MDETVETREKTEKPLVLYHASSNQEIKLFEPRREKYRDPNEGSVVFATPSKPFASMFIVRTDDSWSVKGRFGQTFYTVIGDKNRFNDLDNGGSIYSLPPDSFNTDPHLGMGKTEWASRVTVKPISQENYESGLRAMIENGVQVYFVDQETFKKIKEASDHGKNILRNIQSENQKRNQNIEKI